MSDYRESTQYQSLRDKLRARGFSVRCCSQQAMGEQMMEKLLLFRDSKPPIGAVIVDHPRDGYALYLSTDGNSIDSDVETIHAADEPPRDREGEEAYFAEIVDDDGDRHWSDLIFSVANDGEALTAAQGFADGEGEPYKQGRSLQVRGPFIIPTIPACGTARESYDCGQCEGTGTTDAMGHKEECPVCEGSGTASND